MLRWGAAAMRRWARACRCTRLLIGGSGAAAVLYVVCALAEALCWGAGLRAYGHFASACCGQARSFLRPGASSAGAAMFRFRGRRCGRSLGAFCVGRAAGWAGVRHGVAGAAGVQGAARGPSAGGGVPAAVLRRAHGAALHQRGAAYPQGGERRHRQWKKLFFKPEPPFADGAKDYANSNKQRGLHGRAVITSGGQP